MSRCESPTSSYGSKSTSSVRGLQHKFPYTDLCKAEMRTGVQNVGGPGNTLCNHGFHQNSPTANGTHSSLPHSSGDHNSTCLDSFGPDDANSDTMYVNAKVSSTSQGNSSQSGTTLREHDYIGLSEVSSSPRHVEGSRCLVKGKRVQGVELNLNLGATELRLGPPATLLNSRHMKEEDIESSFQEEAIASSRACYNLQDHVVNAVEEGGHSTPGGASSQDHSAPPSQTDAGCNYVNSSSAEHCSEKSPFGVEYRNAMDRGFAAYGGVHTPSDEARGLPTDVSTASGACQTFINCDSLQKQYREHAKEHTSMTENLMLGIGLMAPSNEVAEGVSMEEHKQLQREKLQQQQIPLASSHETSGSKERAWPERSNSNGVLQQEGSAGGPLYERSLLDQPSSMERPKQERMMQEGSLSDMQGIQGSLVAPSQTQTPTSGVSPHDSIQGLGPSRMSQSGPETRYPLERPASRFSQDNLLGPLDRLPILQEFSMQKLYYAQRSQMMKAASAGTCMTMGTSDHPMPQSSQEHEGGQLCGYPGGRHGSYPISRMVFPKYGGVAGAKRGFSEAIGSPAPESRTGSFNDGVNGFGMVGMSGASREELSGNMGDEAAPVPVTSQQVKHQPGTPPAAMHPWGPKPPSWQQIGLEHARGPFPSQRNPRGQLANKAGEVGADVSHHETPSESNHHGSTEARPAVVNEATPASAPRPQQVVGWPPIRPFRKNTIAGQPPRPAPQETQPRPAPPPAVVTPSAPTVPANGGTPSSQPPNSWLVKVYMDGITIGRKVDLKKNCSYDKLSGALEDMFQPPINGQLAGSQSSSVGENGSTLSSNNRKVNFLQGSDFVLTFEDQDGDLMLVGDVPWQNFISTVKRLRIMKGSEAVCPAPRGRDKVKTQLLTA